MALVRKSNTRRNIITIGLLVAAIVGGGIWLYTSNKPLDLGDGIDAGGGSFRDISKINQFNSTNFEQSSIFNRTDYNSLRSHGTPFDDDETTGVITTGVINPFIPSQ